MLRSSIAVALIYISGGCFYDRARGGSASTGDESSTGTGGTTSGPTTPTSTGASATGTTDPDPATATGELATTTTSAVGSTGEPGTTSTNATDTTGTDTDMPDVCSASPDATSCLQCCADMHESALAYHAMLTECACDVEHSCYGECLLDLCKKETPTGACVNCLAELADDCTKTAVAQCLQNPDCAAYGQCAMDSACTNKP